MFTVEGIRKFHGWTHASLTALLDHVSKLPLELYETELPAFGFRTLREQLIHILNCEGFWVHTLQGLRYSDRTSREHPAVSDVRLLQQEIGLQTRHYLAHLTDQSVNVDAELHFPDER